MAGFVKLHRKFLKWGWYDDVNTKVVFLHLLLNANWEDGEYHGVPVKAGQVVFGRKKYAKALRLSEQNIRTAIEHLHQSGEISTSKVTNKFTVITIENWTKYQCQDYETNQQTNQQLTNDQPTTNQQLTTSKNIRNKEVKKKEDIYSDVPEEILEAFMEWVNMRKMIKKPIPSKLSVTRALNKLDKLATSTEEKIKIIEQSTDKCWQDFFPLKENNNGAYQRDTGETGTGADKYKDLNGWDAHGF